MATRISKPVIPSAFVRLDDRISDPDAYINARDLNVQRQNHNILVARRTKRHLCSIVSANIADRGVYWSLYSVRPPSREGGDMIVAVPLWLSPRTTQVEVVVRAASTSASQDVRMNIFADAPGATGAFATLSPNITGTTLAKNSTTVAIPYQGQQANKCTLNIYIWGKMFGADLLGAPCAIDNVGPDYIDIDTTAAGAAVPVGNRGVYVTTNLGISPRLNTFVVPLSGVNKYRLFVDGPWDVTPSRDDTVEQREAVGIVLESMTFYEKSIGVFYDYQVIP